MINIKVVYLFDHPQSCLISSNNRYAHQSTLSFLHFHQQYNFHVHPLNNPPHLNDKQFPHYPRYQNIRYYQLF